MANKVSNELPISNVTEQPNKSILSQESNEKLVYGNIEELKGKTQHIQELDLVYVRRNIELVSDKKDTNLLFKYDEIILKPYQYKSIKDKYTIDEIFEHKEEILAIEETIKDIVIDNNPNIPNIDNGMIMDDNSLNNGMIDSNGDIPMDNTGDGSNLNHIVKVENKEILAPIRPQSTKSRKVLSKAVSNGTIYSWYQCGKNILKCADTLPMIIKGTNKVNQTVIIGELNGNVIMGKKIATTFTFDITGNTTTNGKLSFQTGNTNNTLISEVYNITNSLNTITFSALLPVSDIYDNNIKARCDNMDGVLTLKEVQIEISDTFPSTYEAYKSQAFNFNSDLYGYDNVNPEFSNYDVFNYKTGKINKNWKVLTINGSESWVLNAPWSAGDYIRCYLSIVDKKVSSSRDSKIFCNKFPQGTISPSVTKELIYNEPNTNVIYLSVNKLRLSEPTLAGFKAWLSKNNLVVVYQIKNVVEVPVTVTGAITPYVGVNNISRNNLDMLLKPNISMTYFPPQVTNIYKIAFYPSKVDIKLIGTREDG